MILIVSPAAVPGCKLVPIFPTTIYWERQPEREREGEKRELRQEVCKKLSSAGSGREEPGPAGGAVWCGVL